MEHKRHKTSGSRTQTIPVEKEKNEVKDHQFEKLIEAIRECREIIQSVELAQSINPITLV
jgi:hypothetical protein